MPSGDGKTRDLVSSVAGAGWDFGITRHPYFEYERELGPRYTVYNRRLMACSLAQQSEAEGYWLLRQKVAVLHTGEWPISFSGRDATRLLDKLFTKDITALKVNRCAYGLACFEDGGLIVDGILLKLTEDQYWYAQADGDFVNWARAHASGMNVQITDPSVFVSQVQGPNALQVLAKASDIGLPPDFNYFSIARVPMGGQEVVVSRTGYTNEIGWEFYTEPAHDADALWEHLVRSGKAFGMSMHGLDSMNIRRIEAGILNAGSDFNAATNPYDVGLGRFVDQHKSNFIGAEALKAASSSVSRLTGLKCEQGTPHISGGILIDGERVGAVTAGAYSPYLATGIGIGLLDHERYLNSRDIKLECIDGSVQIAQLVEMPFYDKDGAIPRGRVLAD